MSGFRTSFTYHRSINWFPGHMAKGLRQIKERLQRDVDLVVEVRDARIPFSSTNSRFETLARRKQRLIVYNKADLADPTAEVAITRAFEEYRGQSVLFTDANGNRNIDKVLQCAADVARNNQSRLSRTTVLVVGMPNVGKSSIINALRRLGVGRGKAAATGAQPGVTRAVVGTIKVFENPDVYIVDSPGVMIPHIEDPITSLKVAITGGVRDHLADEEIMVDYLLFRLNQASNETYVNLFGLQQPTDNVYTLLTQTASRIGAVRRGGEVDTSAAAMYILRKYREGRLGRFTLDDFDNDSLKKYFSPNK
ncbi:mitochondrial GTPase 1 [Syncephalis plumigaleata]|nr:mitochondrial GTPase 1 [Syncephalis plumigaleata]